MAAGTPQFYNSFKEYIADGTMDLDDNSFKCALLTSTETFTATDTVFTDVSNNEVSATNTGYTAGGTAVTATWTRSTGTSTFDLTTNPQWTAGSAGLTAKWAIIYRTGTVNTVTDALVCAVDLNTDSGSATVSATSGNTLTITWNASGLFTLA
jgi:hypothetical protein